MKFSVTQTFDAPAQAVIAAFRHESTWRGFSGLPFVGDPVLDHFERAEPVLLQTSYRVTIDLPTLAHQFIDADKLTFVEHTRLHADGTGSFEIEPDHYGSLLSASGSTTVVDGASDLMSERLVLGHVDVNLGWTGKLFEGPVEKAIVDGFSRALTAQADQVRW